MRNLINSRLQKANKSLEMKNALKQNLQKLVDPSSLHAHKAPLKARDFVAAVDKDKFETVNKMGLLVHDRSTVHPCRFSITAGQKFMFPRCTIITTVALTEMTVRWR